MSKFKIIKSVRVRSMESSDDTQDLKIELFNNKNRYRVEIGSTMGVLATYEYYADRVDDNLIETFKDSVRDGVGVIKGFNVNNLKDYDYFINNALLLYDRSYEIIQDPWNDIAPLYRKYGFDPYYLNNGAKLYISWIYDDKMIGGFEWSDAEGNELSFPRNGNGVIDSKYVRIEYDKTNFNYLGSSDLFTKELYRKEFAGVFKDVDIINQIITDWKISINDKDYPLAVCIDGDCDKIEYKSPFDEMVEDLDVTEMNSEDGVGSGDGVEMDVYVVDVKEVKVGEDFSLNVSIPYSDEFILADDQDLSLLSEEYIERGFSAKEMEYIRMTETVDSPTGYVSDEDSGSYDTSGVNDGSNTPIVRDSKLVRRGYKDLLYMTNLAGKRLTKILGELESFLNKNGFPGTKIGNNGVMRDLNASAYPSSPARAAASLHGCGLAIDVTFKIPGINWRGIGDNGNLASNAKLNKVMYAFSLTQSDIAWGGFWGNSDPKNGKVIGHGKTEYHHFEIRFDHRAKYWEVYKEDIAKFGFVPNDLLKYGRGSNLHKLMMALMNSGV